MTKINSLSIFLPAFNEEKNIIIVLDQILKLAPKISSEYEVIVINDGSLDQTAKNVEEIIRKNKKVRLINHKKNLGYGAALKTGFYSSKMHFITYMDSDGQFDFSEIDKLIPHLESAEVVVGYRIKRADKKLRILIGHLWTFLMGVLLGVKLKDIDCGFKIIKREVIDNISPLESNGATISAELLAKAKRKGYKIKEVGLVHKARKFGTATGGNPTHIFRAFYDLALILPKI
jgi:glycosyltransferase involved in cell wall biosynthesis